MKTGKCPKCGSDDVHSGTHLFPKTGPFASNSIPISLLSMAALDNYVCVKCGYVERYVSGAEKLKEIAESWPKVGEAEPAAAQQEEKTDKGE